MADSVDLHPDVVKAIQNLQGSKLGRRYDRMARKRYGISGVALAGKTVAGEFGGRSTATGRGVVSSAGARGPAQFIPSTRQQFIKQYGIDPWKDDRQAIEGLMQHQINTGVEGYNPGMPTYKDYILNQRLNRDDLDALHASMRGKLPPQAGKPVTLAPKTSHEVSLQSNTIPAQSFAPEREAAKRSLLTGGPLNLKKLLAYKSEVNALQDVPAQRVTGDLQVTEKKGKPIKLRTQGAPANSQASPKASNGRFIITGPNPKRLVPELVSYAKEVSAIYGKPLTGSDGTGHSYLTVNGNVSEHSTGHATDIPARGRELIRMGRAALIAAGMPRAQAMKQNGGLYNVGNHQIIFNTMEGGDHRDHLHISSHANRR